MYLVKDTLDRYWILNKIHAGEATGATVREAFHIFTQETFTFSEPNSKYFFINNAVVDADFDHDSDILIEFPDHWDYDTFAEHYPELTI